MFYVYITSNKSRTVLYTGVTNNIFRRMDEHRNGLFDSFTKKYKVVDLIFCESYKYIDQAISAEKKIKGWRRNKKLSLVLNYNPKLEDLL